jgi:hypothetical protein
MANLHEAKQASQAAVDATTPDSPCHAGFLSNFAGHLEKNHLRTRAMDDLDHAIRITETVA